MMTQEEFDAIADEFGVEHPREVGEKHGLSWKEQLDLMAAHNQKIFDEWTAEYAKRLGRPTNEVRAEVIQQRQLTAQHCDDAYRREVGKESKEDKDMTKKANTNQTTSNSVNTESKEDKNMKNEQTATANNTEKKFNYKQSKAAAKAFRDENIGKVTKSRKKAVEVTSCLPGKGATNLSDDPAELALLAKAAAVFGWGTEFCTVNQAAKFFGTLKDPECIGWFISWLPKTPKSGKNAGIEQTFETMVFPKDAFEWATESGEPEFDEEKAAQSNARRAKSRVKKAQNDMKKAYEEAGLEMPKTRKKATKKTSTKKAAPKVDVPNIDMDAALNAAIEKLVSEKLAEAVAKALANAS